MVTILAYIFLIYTFLTAEGDDATAAGWSMYGACGITVPIDIILFIIAIVIFIVIMRKRRN